MVSIIALILVSSKAGEVQLSDNGPEFRGSIEKEHPFEVLCKELGVDTHGQARGTFKTIQASLDLNPGFSGIVHI